MKRLWSIVFMVCTAGVPALCAEPLIVVDDRGGDSALPYYSALKLQPNATATHSDPPLHLPKHFSEADMLPVHSTHLSPGIELPRSTTAPGLTPLFLIGDDDRSRDWLRQRAGRLRELHAQGLVVSVDSLPALTALRTLAPDLTLLPVSGDDLAQRLHLRHYPVLITATAIEQ